MDFLIDCPLDKFTYCEESKNNRNLLIDGNYNIRPLILKDNNFILSNELKNNINFQNKNNEKFLSVSENGTVIKFNKNLNDKFYKEKLVWNNDKNFYQNEYLVTDQIRYSNLTVDMYEVHIQYISDFNYVFYVKETKLKNNTEYIDDKYSYQYFIIEFDQSIFPLKCPVNLVKSCDSDKQFSVQLENKYYDLLEKSMTPKKEIISNDNLKNLDIFLNKKDKKFFKISDNNLIFLFDKGHKYSPYNELSNVKIPWDEKNKCYQVKLESKQFLNSEKKVNLVYQVYFIEIDNKKNNFLMYLKKGFIDKNKKNYEVDFDKHHIRYWIIKENENKLLKIIIIVFILIIFLYVILNIL